MITNFISEFGDLSVRYRMNVDIIFILIEENAIYVILIRTNQFMLGGICSIIILKWIIYIRKNLWRL